MKPRKKTCYVPEKDPKPFAVHHTDYGIFSELRITNVGEAVMIADLIVNDAFHPAVEVGGKEWFRPLELPRTLAFGDSLAVMLHGPAGFVRPEDCYGGYPQKAEVILADGTAVLFELWEIIRGKA